MAQPFSDTVESNKKELKRVLRSILEIPNDGGPTAVKRLVLHLNQLLRIKVVTPPTSEVMVLLQAHKPLLFHATRVALSRSSHLNILFQIKGDTALAEERLNQLMNDM